MESEITVDLFSSCIFTAFGTLFEILSGSGRRSGQQDYYVNPRSRAKRRPESDRRKQTRREPQHQRQHSIASPCAVATGGGFTRGDEDDEENSDNEFCQHVQADEMTNNSVDVLVLLKIALYMRL